MRVAFTIVVALMLAGSAQAATPKAYWTETFAEKRALEKVRVPCMRIRDEAGCDVAAAESEQQVWDDRLASCTAMTDVNRSLMCLNSMTLLRSPVENLRWVTKGFPLKTAECVGGGKTDASGFRFSQLRCQVVVWDYRNARQYAEITGRLVIYVTGVRTFRWAIIR